MASPTEHAHNVAEAIKAAPPLTVGGLTLGGFALSDWVLLLTAIYTILQIGFLLRDKLFKRKDNDHGRR